MPLEPNTTAVAAQLVGGDIEYELAKPQRLARQCRRHGLKVGGQNAINTYPLATYQISKSPSPLHSRLGHDADNLVVAAPHPSTAPQLET